MTEWLRRSEYRILSVLADGGWHAESALHSTFTKLQDMYLRGMIEGGMLTDGGTARDRLWRLTAKNPLG